jgi:hypothetical protein
MKDLFLRWQLMGSCLLAIAIMEGGHFQPVSAQPLTNHPAPITPLPQSEGNASDLTGTFAKDSAIWLGGVGGEGDIEATDNEDNPYEIRSPQSDNNSIWLPNLENPYQTRIQLGQF